MKDSITETINQARTSVLIDALIHLWQMSVKVGHSFLYRKDIEQLQPYVREGICCVENLIVLYDKKNPVAFMGIQSDKIEMLFVNPNFIGMGLGKRLVRLAVKRFGVRFVDVNEQNHDAEGFYIRMGFRTFARKEYDGQGNHFPILNMQLDSCVVRRASHKDINEVRTLFRDTVIHVNRRDYSLEEVKDWALCGDDSIKWERLMDTHHFIVAEITGIIVGFSSVDANGYLHSMFVHKDFQKRGVATRLLWDIESYMCAQNMSVITSEVSITARPFFEKNGFKVIKEQKRIAYRMYLKNYKMEKRIFSE